MPPAAGHALAAALQTLNGRERDAFSPPCLGELSFEEISDARQVPLGTVRSRRNRARQKMRKALESKREGPPPSTCTRARM